MSQNKKKQQNLPENMTLREASDFWDEHSFLDYDDIHEVNFDVNLKKEIHDSAIDKEIANKIREIAQLRGVSAETLVNLWLKSKLTEAA